MDSPNSPKTPKAPNVGKLFQQGVGLNNRFMPQWLMNELNYRGSQDPARIQQQQGLQQQFGPNQYKQMLDAFKMLDPTFFSNREQLGGLLSSQLGQGSALSPDQAAEIERGVRGSQVARGNASGGAAAIAEAYAKGSAGLQLQQQRITNMGNFLSQPTMAAQAAAIPPVSADRSFAYENPNAGWQMVQAGMGNFQNQLGVSALNNQPQGNPWMSALGSIGQIAGPILGSIAFSDRRLKTNIRKVGTAPSGTGIYEYNYRGPRMRGPIAQDVEKHIPGAVITDPVSRFKMVALHRVDVPMERIG